MPLSAREIIEQKLAEQGLNRARLAHQAGISLDSLNKCMQRENPRPFTPRMLVPIAAVLSARFDELKPMAAPAVAPERLGAYARASVGWLEGRYLAIRYAFQRDGLILAHPVSIRWDAAENCLIHLRYDYFDGPVVQRGQVAIASHSGHIHLVSGELGAFELCVLSRPAEDGRFQGLVTMLYHRRGTLVPGASPLVLLPVPAAGLPSHGEADGAPDPPPPLPGCGEVEPGHASFARYARLLQLIEVQGHARLASGLGVG